MCNCRKWRCILLGKKPHWANLGVGNTTDQYHPTKVLLPSGRTATAIEAGAYHTCAILDDNSINCWGQNNNGQIGDGTTDYRDSPASVILAGLSNPIQISAGQSSTCALFDNGRINVGVATITVS